MLKNKTIFGVFLALILAAVQAASAGAAPLTQASTLDGTIQSCSTATDPLTSAIIVVCTVNLTAGGTQTVRLSAVNAQTLGLAVINPDGSVTITAAAGQTVSIDTTLLLPDPCVLPTGADQPVGAALTKFFCGSLGLDYATIQAFQSQGMGYGVIAQACFMAQVLQGNGMLCEAILNAKKTGNYSGLTLPGGATVSNWGQLRKTVFADGAKNAVNLGSIVSGRANGSGNGNGHGNGHGHGNAKGH